MPSSETPARSMREAGSSAPRCSWTQGVLFLGLFFTACAPAGKPEPVIAASIPPVASLTAYLVGDRYPVVSILPPGRSPHDYEPSPADVDRARGALVFVFVHREIDGWMARTARGVIGKEAPMIGMEGEPLAAGRDPHLWLDLEVVEAFIPRLADALAAADPPGADGYVARSRALLDSLHAIDADCRNRLAPVADAPFAILHPAFEAFVLRYGLNLVAVLEHHPEGEALPQSMGEAVGRLQSQGARVVFAEPQLPPRTAVAVARDLGAEVSYLDPLGGEDVPGRRTYFDLLRWNTRSLVEALE